MDKCPCSYLILFKQASCLLADFIPLGLTHSHLFLLILLIRSSFFLKLRIWFSL